jgi:hypothetical protein
MNATAPVAGHEKKDVLALKIGLAQMLKVALIFFWRASMTAHWA